MLIVARAVQGLGAALMTPQTMAVITRTFPPDRRGAAMGLWGAIAGVATLVGPILGGVLVDGLGWEWIFFINVPVGIVGFVLAARLVPEAADARAPVRHPRRGAQRARHVPPGLRHPGGPALRLGHDRGPIWSGLIIAGVVVLGVFVCWQRATRASRCCRSACSATATSRSSNIAITAVGFTVTAMALPADVLRAGSCAG